MAATDEPVASSACMERMLDMQMQMHSKCTRSVTPRNYLPCAGTTLAPPIGAKVRNLRYMIKGVI